MKQQQGANAFQSNLLPTLQSLTEKLVQQGFIPKVHFELEGAYSPAKSHQALDFHAVNQKLKTANIAGELKTEYWQYQWEYVSHYHDQTPAEEAQHLANAIFQLPGIMKQCGAQEVFLKPVVWGGDQGRYIQGSSSIFSTDRRPVHIPNAVQINVSIQDLNKKNLIATTSLGEWLQWHLLQTSYACCLLFLPEEDAFHRLGLRHNYSLDAELSSPFELSGGHQGSIALYREKGKHNQDMGIVPLLYGSHDQVLSYHQDWHSTARIEHRLGATSQHYDPYLNVLFILLNILEAIESWQIHPGFPPQYTTKALPKSLYDNNKETGAISLFKQDYWLSKTIAKHLNTEFEEPQLQPQTPHPLAAQIIHHLMLRYEQNSTISLQ
ncbi:hypothetical protein KIH87_01265 [Paraneptunicella aestuarii]|uniref:hypothetical protein n=1 Tax=Paraneptunicella aestuarii TaxID=2831148 RepID=UPI001E3F0E49|nr:hypothetical protein [Paraneptunicella aestuarii]UAA39026.1 hypothetical protein KIH87_01265 [Paraneptunicella aestuarii]